MQKNKPKKNKDKIIFDTDLDKNVERYIFYFFPVLIIFYYFFGSLSKGFYGEDEIAYLMNIKYSFENIANLIGNANKPGYKLLFYLPSLLGDKILILTHSIISACSFLTVYFLSKELKIKNSSIMALIFAFQPLFLQFSFRTWPENLTGLVLVLSILFYYKKQHALAAAFSTYLMTIRIEYVVISIILGILYLYNLFSTHLEKHRFSNENDLKSTFITYLIPLLILFLGPLALNISGYFVTGDPLFLLHDMKSSAIDKAEAFQSFSHYFKMYIFVIGPVSFTFLILGILEFFEKKQLLRSNIKNFGLLYFIFIGMFFLFALMSWRALNFGGGTGALRFLLPLSPLAAIIVGIGLNYSLETKNKTLIYSAFGFIAAVVFFFLSYKSDGTTLGIEKDYTKFIFILFSFLLLFVFYMNIFNQKYFIIFITALALCFTLLDEKPMPLKDEYKTINEVYDFWKSNYQDRKTYCNHIYFYNLAKADYGHSEKFLSYNDKSLDNIPIGSIIIWDNHYGYRPEFNSGLPLDHLLKNPNFQGRQRWNGKMNNIAATLAIIFEKIDSTKNEDYILMQEIFSVLNSEALKHRMVLCNHPYFRYCAGLKDDSGHPKYKSLNMANLKDAPAGSLIIRDGYYDFRPEWENSEVPIEFLSNNPDYRELKVWLNIKGEEFANLFEKTK